MSEKTKHEHVPARRDPPFSVRMPNATRRLIQRAAAKTRRSAGAYMLYHAEAAARADLAAP